MSVAIALLRGINVGGNRKLPMEDLRAICGLIGLRDARTLIQSGNVVFRCAARDLPRAASKLEDAIEKRFKFRPGVVVRSVEQLRSITTTHPFAGRQGLDPAKFVVMFLACEPDASAQKALGAIRPDPEELALAGTEVFLYFPLGIGKARLPMATVERAVKVPGTCRNWNTTTRLLAMAEELHAAE